LHAQNLDVAGVASGGELMQADVANPTAHWLASQSLLPARPKQVC
jgi:hypothetical protein